MYTHFNMVPLQVCNLRPEEFGRVCRPVVLHACTHTKYGRSYVYAALKKVITWCCCSTSSIMTEVLSRYHMGKYMFMSASRYSAVCNLSCALSLAAHPMNQEVIWLCYSFFKANVKFTKREKKDWYSLYTSSFCFFFFKHQPIWICWLFRYALYYVVSDVFRLRF